MSIHIHTYRERHIKESITERAKRREALREGKRRVEVVLDLRCKVEGAQDRDS